MKKLLILVLLLAAGFYAGEKGLLPDGVATVVNAGAEGIFHVVEQVKEKYIAFDEVMEKGLSSAEKDKRIPCRDLSTFILPYEKDVELTGVTCSDGVYYASESAHSAAACDYTHMDEEGNGLHLSYQGSGAGTSGYAVYRTSDSGWTWNHYGYVTFGGYMRQLSGVEDTVVLNTCNPALSEPLTTLLITTDDGISWSIYDLDRMFPELAELSGVYAEVLDLTTDQMTLGRYQQEAHDEPARVPDYFYTVTMVIRRDSLEIIQETYVSEAVSLREEQTA